MWVNVLLVAVHELRASGALTPEGIGVVPVLTSKANLYVFSVHHTLYRLPTEYGGLRIDQVKRLKELETENTKLKRAISDLTLDKQILG